MFKYPLTIREFHLDTFGHVNNATYLSLYEEARWELIEGGGFGLAKIKELGMGPVILDLHLTFKRELVNRDQIIITALNGEMKNSLVFRMHQEMLRADDNSICSTLDVSVGLMDLKKRKLIAPTSEWLSAISAAGSVSPRKV